MSLEFIDVFFPTTSYLLRTKFRRITEYVFPTSLQHLCHRPVYELRLGWNGRDTIPIAWPALLPIMVLGIIVGIVGHIMLRPSPHRRSNPQTPSWSLAMAFYAAMNFAAVFSHCLVPRNSGWQSPLVCMDIAATACCCFSAIYAVISGELTAARRRPRYSDPAEKKHVANLLLGNGLLNISAFAVPHIPFMSEFLYIGMALNAGLIVGLYVLRRPALGRQGIWVATLWAGAVIALSGIPLDRHLCRWGLAPQINHVVLLFVGCHVIMLSLFLYVREELAVLRMSSGGKKKSGAGRPSVSVTAEAAGVGSPAAPRGSSCAVSAMSGVSSDQGSSDVSKDSPSNGKCRSRMRRRA